MRTKNKDKELNHRHFIGLRLTDVELDLLDQGAACLSISRSEYLRKLLLEKQLRRRITSGLMNTVLDGLPHAPEVDKAAAYLRGLLPGRTQYGGLFIVYGGCLLSFLEYR